jgi:hypothetical protein
LKISPNISFQYFYILVIGCHFSENVNGDYVKGNRSSNLLHISPEINTERKYRRNTAVSRGNFHN